VILVTGGAGFIGSNFVLDWLGRTSEGVVNLDCLTHAGNLENLKALKGDARHFFVRGDICDGVLVDRLFAAHSPRAVVHFAAESHVDRSIRDPGAFVLTNVDGTCSLLEAARRHFNGLTDDDRRRFRFLQVSTDEVYGSLAAAEPAFTELSPHAPNNPYAASKAAGDHLARAWHCTFGLPVITMHCGNNYGPFQFPEKLIPLMIVNALEGKPLPLYGDGQHVRDWLFVRDHCAAIRDVLDNGWPGEVYNVGGRSERKNIEVVETVCAILDELRPKSAGRYADQIAFVKDRPGHDRRYAIDSTKIETELGWRPSMTFESGLRQTVQWYLDHPAWVGNVKSGAYRQWIERQYGATD
jgi:dTDP-glucose 4,6-dehydratase